MKGTAFNLYIEHEEYGLQPVHQLQQNPRALAPEGYIVLELTTTRLANDQASCARLNRPTPVRQ
jgi:hypothetical protein